MRKLQLISRFWGTLLSNNPHFWENGHMGNYADKTKLQHIQHGQKEIAPRDGALGECPIFAELWRRCFLSDPCRCPVGFPSMDPSWAFSQGQWCWLMWKLGRGFTGWWLTYPSEKYESIMKVNGKDDIPYIMENNPNVWNHQPVYIKLDEISTSKCRI